MVQRGAAGQKVREQTVNYNNVYNTLGNSAPPVSLSNRHDVTLPSLHDNIGTLVILNITICNVLNVGGGWSCLHYHLLEPVISIYQHWTLI